MSQQVLGTHCACQYQFVLVIIFTVDACSDHYSMQNEEVYNVTYHRGVDRPCQGGVEKQTFSMVA